MDIFEYNNILVYRSIYAPVKSNMFVLMSVKEAVVFDPNENDELLLLFHNNGIEKVHILLTHGHYDHISGVNWLKDNIHADLYCHEKCADRLANSKRPLARLVAVVLANEDKKDGGHRYADFKSTYKPFTITADKTFEKEDHFVIGDLDFKVISTPGHSEGSACYILNRNMIFTGDTLLQDYPAITKFPGGDTKDYNDIALPFLKSLDKNMTVMPGHGDPFVLGNTKMI